MSRNSLQSRVLILVALGTFILVGILGVIGYFTVRDSINRALEERLALAEITADHLQYILTQSLRRIGDIAFSEGVDMEDGNLEPEKRALREAYFQSIFTEGVFLTDREGTIVWIEPYRPSQIGNSFSSYDFALEALREGRPTISDVIYLEPDRRAVASVVFPLKNREGRVAGLAGGFIGIMGPALQETLQPGRLGHLSYTEVVDSKGVVLATTNLGNLLQESDHGHVLANLIQLQQTAVRTCHTCHEPEKRQTEVMAFAPLYGVPWGVSIRQPEAEALAPARRLEQRFIILGVPLIFFAILFAWGMVRSVVKPIEALTASAQKIASGNLSDPVPDLGEDEIGRLARSFETMRGKLRESLRQVQEWSKGLEVKVQERTRELEESRAARGELLRKLIYAQEEERRRVARELHDETSQDLAALAVAADAVAASTQDEKLKERLSYTKQLASQALEGVHQIILDLRPSMLDDLGLLSALKFYAESRLESAGIKVQFETVGEERRLPGQVETALFRVAQEAITNIARHSRADNVMISVDFREDSVAMDIEDDGIGFNLQEVARQPTGGKGLGLLGMEERVSLLGGELNINTEPGSGTSVAIRVPLAPGEDNGQDTRAHSG